jgi:hypothetical protein
VQKHGLGSISLDLPDGSEVVIYEHLPATKDHYEMYFVEEPITRFRFAAFPEELVTLVEDNS